MMRKFNKKKVSRRGAILVTVVFVLAFATIFIAAAMTLTQATRKRIYADAGSDQARLTVTSVAEAFYNAVHMCEFDDDTLVDMCDGNQTIRVEASASADKIPGIETSGVKNDNSYTSVHFYRKPNVTGASKPEQYTYYADFSTHIYDKVENVRATLSYTPQPKNKGSAPFTTQIDINNEFGQNNLELVGEGAEDQLSNVFLVRQGGKNKDSSFSSDATMIYCDGAVAFKDESFNSEDIVFLSGAYLQKRDDATNYKGNKVKNFFFFGDKNEQIAQSERGNFDKTGLNFFLCNRSASSSNSQSWVNAGKPAGQGNKVYQIDASGNFTGSNKITMTDTQAAAFKKKVQTYAQYNDKYKAGGTEPFPTTDSFLKSAKNLKIGKTYNSSANDSTLTKHTPISFGDFLKENCYQETGKGLAGGVYYFNANGCSQADDGHPTKTKGKLGAKEPYVIVLKKDTTYRFWFASGTYTPKHVVFICEEAKPGNPVLFLLESGAKIYWPGDPNNMGNGGTSSNGEVGGNGIFAVQGRKFDSCQDAYDYIVDIRSKNYGSPKSLENTSGKYSKHYNGKNEPCAMVIGMGKNIFATDKNIVMEAFIGMFNEDYKTKNQSTVAFRNGTNTVFYGRLMTDGLGFNNDSGNIINPACPGTSTLIGSDPTLKKLITGFKLTSMIYYYDLPTTE